MPVTTPPLFKSGRVFDDELAGVPNPKPTQSDKSKFGSLASLYTSFSTDFAEATIDICLRAGARRIADPFGGMGTLAEAARARPVELSVSDLSPFATLAALLRSSEAQSIDQAVSELERYVRRIDAKDETDFYSRVLFFLSDSAETSLRSVLKSPSKPKNRTAALGLFVAALSRIQLHQKLVGSNPTWTKRPSQVADTGAVVRAFTDTTEKVRRYAGSLSPLHRSNRTAVSWSDIAQANFEPGELDAIITSPPYANRTDYIRHYLPASELLLNAIGEDERAVRSRQIGTPLIRESEAQHRFPASVSRLLNEIRAHPSQASESYYHKGFLYYFSDMLETFDRMKTWLSDKGILILVVQDSTYKDLHVPTAQLLMDLASSRGYQLLARRDWSVQRRLSRLSPHSRKGRGTSLTEAAIILSK